MAGMVGGDCLSGKMKVSRMAAVSSFLVVMGLALTMAGAVVRAKFMGDSTTIVNGFYVEKTNKRNVQIPWQS